MIKKRILTIFLIVVVVFGSAFIIPAAAAGAGISAPSSAFLNDEITVTVTFQCTTGSGKVGAIDATLSFDATALQCTSNPAGTNADGNGKYLISYYDAANTSATHSMTFKFKCKKAGTSGIHVAADITDTDLVQTAKKEYSTTVKIVDKSTLSGNAKLKSLTLSVGSLSPAFDPDVTTYNISVDYSVTKVLVSATTQEPAAKIDVQGSSSMKVGNNVRTVVVTAPNGTIKKYTINITRYDTTQVVQPPQSDVPVVNPYVITVDGENRYMVGEYTDIPAPKGFGPALTKINDTDIPVLQDVVSGKTIVYATKKDGTAGAFYLYDKENASFSPFRYLAIQDFHYAVLDYTDTTVSVEGFQYAKVNVGDYTVNGFVYNEAELSDFVIFYGESFSGDKGFYRYDKKDKTIQRAADFTTALNKPAETEPEEEEKSVIARFIELDFKSKMIVISALLIIVLLIVLIIIMIVKSAKKRPSKEALEAAEEQEYMEGYGETTHLYLDDDYEEDSPIDDDFIIREDE